TGCLEFALIDRTTGRVHPGMEFNMDFPSTYEGPYGLKYRRSSRLLVAYHADAFKYPVFVDYYVWDESRFKLLQAHKLQAPKKANKTVQRTGASRSVQQTNRMSSAAGSRR